LETQLKNATVLVVEDEALIRLNTAQILEEAGYAVLQAANADGALEILEWRSDVALVFTDVSMPGSMDGLAMAHVVRKRWPKIAIVVTSGKTLPRRDEVLPGPFLPKPYTQKELLFLLEVLP